MKLWFGRLCRLALANWVGVRALRVGVSRYAGWVWLALQAVVWAACRLALANWVGVRALRVGVSRYAGLACFASCGLGGFAAWTGQWWKWLRLCRRCEVRSLRTHARHGLAFGREDPSYS
ncbi:MAG TPA: hypothetical protein ENJ82_03145 [Bacteroidetes bacterium]|nr:hypothetical protein [Bacteroidota bacterium]